MTEYIRKIKQISATDLAIYALCNDGTVWVYVDDAGEWFPVKDIPAAP